MDRSDPPVDRHRPQDRQRLQVLPQRTAVVGHDHGRGAAQQGVAGQHASTVDQHAHGVGGVAGQVDDVGDGAEVADERRGQGARARHSALVRGPQGHLGAAAGGELAGQGGGPGRVVEVVMGDQHPHRAGVTAGHQQLGEVLGVLGAGVDDPGLIAVAHHIGVGALQRHRARIVRAHRDQLDARRCGLTDGVVLAHRLTCSRLIGHGGGARGRGRPHERVASSSASSTSRSSSTGASRGSTATPTAARECAAAWPKTSPSSSLAPLITAGWAVKSGAEAT